MSDERASLIAAAGAEPEFSLSAPPEIFAESESGGEHTAARLAVRRPDTYRAIVGLSAEGVGALRCASMLAVSVHTVLAVRRREGAAIDQERARLADRFRAGAEIGAEVAIDMLSDPAQRRRLNALQAATAAAILADKAELLGGQSQTIRIEVEHRAAPDQLTELVAAARARMDSGARTDAAKGPAVVDLEPGSVEVGPARETGAKCIDGVVSRVVSDSAATSLHRDACGDANSGADDGALIGPGDGAPAGADGGGGGRAFDGGGHS